DLIEEVGRVFGFQNIPAKATVRTLNFKPLPEARLPEATVVAALASLGYNEVISYSFIDREYAKLFTRAITDELCLANPISSEMGFMRPTLWPGLLKAIEYNANRQVDRMRIFEIGLRFTSEHDKIEQRKTIAGACYGNYLPEGWGNAKRHVDLFDVKNDVLALLKLAHNTDNVTFKPATNMALHPGQSLDIYLHDKLLGTLGVLHPQLQQTLQLPNPVALFEVDYDMLVMGNIPVFNSFSKFPAVRRDIALLLNHSITAESLQQAIKQQVGALLTDLVVFDVYTGKGVPDNQKSMALGLTLQDPERTLTDAEVNDIFTNLINMLQRDFKASLR
ncbi:MAG TPA: phenylalanine--tRNA ligase subunit beta, partial [Gammaproteobacteria bacterium]|nr:phenylalanine--tRNA ligase subunit beta [Gammaproteobacteria bacterium]